MCSSTHLGIPNPTVSDPVYDAKYEAAGAATTIEEQNRIAGERNQYGSIEKNWTIWGPDEPHLFMWRSSRGSKGYNGEGEALGPGQYNAVFARLWIDSELKEAMGH